jgi:hypothetical protein
VQEKVGSLTSANSTFSLSENSSASMIVNLLDTDSMAISQPHINGKQTSARISRLKRHDNVTIFAAQPVALQLALKDLQPNLRIGCSATTIEFVTSEDGVRFSDSNDDEGRPSSFIITAGCRCPDCGRMFDLKSKYDDHVLETHTPSLDIKYNYEGAKLEAAYLPI